MIERGEHLCFTLESRHAIGVPGKGFGQDFQRHVAAELGVSGAVDLAHSTCADRGGDPIVGKRAADQISPPVSRPLLAVASP